MEVKNQSKLNFLNSITQNNNIFECMYDLYTVPNGEQRDFLIGKTYDKLIGYISEKKIIDSVNNIFKYYNTFTSGKKITGKKILTAYVITVYVRRGFLAHGYLIRLTNHLHSCTRIDTGIRHKLHTN